MDKNQFQGHWNQIKGKVKETFGKLTDDDMMKLSGKRDELVGKLQTLYGSNKEKIEHQLAEIENNYYTTELHSHWNDLSAKLQQKWNALTEDDMKRIKGKSDQLITQLQERYHFDKERAQKEFHAFMDSLPMSREKVGSDKVGSHGKDHRK